MREIKFRAWDVLGKKMIHEVWEIGFGLTEDSESWLVGDDQQIKNFKLMQYTGLKDRNGVDIYEGDVLSGVDMHNLEVIKIKYGWGTKFIDDGQTNIDPFDDALFEDFDCEVIGNIYQNPDLLKEGA